MFILKKKYFLIIENIEDINLSEIKRYNKFFIIYRNSKNLSNIDQLQKFRKKCRLKLIKFFISNNLKLAVQLNADGVYLSSYNKDFLHFNTQKKDFIIIGSAHNSKEIYIKTKQNCKYILLSKLFSVDYDKEAATLGVIKFNKFSINMKNKLVPLGGIKISNLNNLKNLNCEAFAVLSEVKKKPVKIINRLF